MEGPRSVLERAMRILGSFDSTHPVQTVSEISRRCALPVSTAHRIVLELCATGALERTSTGGYRVGLRLWEIASHAPRSVGLQRVVMPYMQQLVEATKCPVHVAIREDEQAVIIERLVPAGGANERPRVGGRYPLHATAVGQVLLAYSPPEVQDSVLDAPLSSYTSHTPTQPLRLRRLLAEVRQNDLAISDRQINPEFVVFAAPIRFADREVRAALSVIVPHERSKEPGVGERVKAAAQMISAALSSGGTKMSRPLARIA